MDDGKVTEIVIPSGAFARLRRATYRDFIEALAGDAKMINAEFAARVVTIDGRKITANALIQKGVATMKGIA